MGEQQMYKQLLPLMKNKKYKTEVGWLRAHRATGDDLRNDRINLDTQHLPVIKEINRIVKNAQKKAELRLQQEAKVDASLRGMQNSAWYQQMVDQRMKVGDVPGARDLQKKELETRNLLQMAK